MAPNKSTLAQRRLRHEAYLRRKNAHYALTLEWKRQNRERSLEIQRAAGARYRARVLRQERCIVCRVRFPWTMSREENRRKTGARIVCSSRCGVVAAKREREHDSRKRPARPARRDRLTEARPGKPKKDQQPRA